MNALRVNADYEAELFYGKAAPLAINQSIEFLALFLEPTPLWSTKKYSPEYLEYIQSITGHVVKVVNSGPCINWWGPLKDLETERQWNSKLTSTDFLISQGWCKHTHVLRKPEDVAAITENRTYLVKDPFGMSGQKFHLLPEALDLKLKQKYLLEAIKKNPLIIEPYFSRKFDFSQYIFPDGRVIFYQNIVDDKFQYKGSVFKDRFYPELDRLPFYKDLLEEEWQEFSKRSQAIRSHFAQFKNEVGYSIDSFIYEQNGEFKIRTLSEINYRRTMGRVAYELSQKFGGTQPWTALVFKKTNPKQPLYKELHLEGATVLSPGDSRFELIFLKAVDDKAGRKLLLALDNYCLTPSRR